MRLTDLSPNECAIVNAVEGGMRLRQQLELRGIRAGRRITMISNGFGPVVLRVDCATLVIGRGMAGRVLVEKGE